MPSKPRTKRERNIYGDFVVTKINIKEREIVIPQNDEEESEEEESEEEEEQTPAVEEAEEEVKKEPVKILSKKEQKRLEDEEFERLMNEVGAPTTEGAKAKAAAAEESKQSAT
mmetsp:Transcript_35508/g.43492  ORF Transcript_35508/g.43492 Transcript_35508/m.43492 type:complete len:113 (+) Transcript_35508:262-600(+)